MRKGGGCTGTAQQSEWRSDAVGLFDRRRFSGLLRPRTGALRGRWASAPHRRRRFPIWATERAGL